MVDNKLGTTKMASILGESQAIDDHVVAHAEEYMVQSRTDLVEYVQAGRLN